MLQLTHYYDEWTNRGDPKLAPTFCHFLCSCYFFVNTLNSLQIRKTYTFNML